MRRSFGGTVLATLAAALAVPAGAGAATISAFTPGDEAPSPPNGTCTLREAVLSMNQSTNVDGCANTGAAYGTNNTIELLATTYVAGGPNDGGGIVDAAGDFDIAVPGSPPPPVTIRGAGPTLTQISGGGSDRVIEALSPVNLVGVTVLQGHASGPGIQGAGGAIRSSGALTLTDTVVTLSNATTGGGGIFALGGATLTNSTVSNNTALSMDGGGVDGVALSLTNTTVSGNHAPSGKGGGIHGDFTLTNSTVSGNDAGGNGGGIEGPIDPSTNSTITGSTISDNTSTGGDGGGIAGSSALNITRSTISGNRTTSTADKQGGGIFFSAAGKTMNITDSTISGNRATGWGGAISNGSGTTNLRGDTITRNIANTDNDGSGMGAIDQAPGAGSTINLSNTIVAGNTNVSATGPPSDCNSNSGGGIQSQGYNLIGVIPAPFCAIAPTTGDQVIGSADPLVAPLANNGGPTQTSALQPGSPAIDGGSPAAPGSGVAACTTADQRGTPRPQGPACDIGAYEFPYRTLTVNHAGTGSGSVSGPSISCGATGTACSASYIDGASVTLTATPADGGSFDGWGGECSGTGDCTLTMSADRSVTATFTAPPGGGDGGGSGDGGGGASDGGGANGGGGGNADTTPPSQSLAARKKQEIDKLGLTDTVSEDSTLSGQATVNVPAVQKRSIKSRIATVDASAGKPAKLRFKFSKRGLRKIKAALAGGTRLKATIQVTATDAAGNAATGAKKVRLTN